MNDRNVSHINVKVLTKVIGLEKRFDKITTTRGKEHSFVGTVKKYNGDKIVMLSMQDNIKK